jgi:two-component system, NarL family, response regulator NreC
VPISIILADDHSVVRQGLRTLLEREGFHVIAEASDGREAVGLAKDLKPEVAVLDLTMPRMNGLEAGRAIGQSGATRVVLLTMHAGEQHIAAALRAGIRAYVLKTQAADDLVDAIRAVVKGEAYLSPGVSDFVLQAYLDGERAPADLLTPRERQVLQLVAEGNTSKEIAVLLGVSVKTAESYRAHVMEKLDIHHTAGLVRYAIRAGLVEP